MTTHSLELSPPAQYCFNHNIGSSYTLTHWSVTADGGLSGASRYSGGGAE